MARVKGEHTIKTEMQAEEEAIRSIYPDGSLEEPEQLQGLIKEFRSLRTFSDRLTQFIIAHGYSKEPSNTGEKVRFLNDIVRSGCGTNVGPSKETIWNWFKGATVPGDRANQRDNMYAVCFALNLSLDRTTDFFERVYLKRPFDRRLEEMVFRFCLNNKLSFSDAMNLIGQSKEAPAMRNVNPVNDPTMQLWSNVDNMNDPVEFLRYLNDQKHQFKVLNVSAIEAYEIMKKAITDINRIEEQKDDEKGKRQSINIIWKCLFAGVPTDDLPENLFSTREEIDQYWSKSALPEQIYANFPTPDDFYEIQAGDANAETLRRVLILLKFYLFGRGAEKKDDGAFDAEPEQNAESRIIREQNYNQFRSELDDMLDSCGLSPSYMPNPFDWLFLISAYSTDPLYTFNSILEVSYN